MILQTSFIESSATTYLCMHDCLFELIQLTAKFKQQANVVYEVPCTCGKVYIGETTRRLGTCLKEHKDTCIKGFTDKSAIAKHAWMEDHPIGWDDTRILQHASRTMELVVKEAICIRTVSLRFGTPIPPVLRPR